MIRCKCGCREVCDDYGRLKEPYSRSRWYRVLVHVNSFEELLTTK